MSDERLSRMEDMLGTLIHMVGYIKATQEEMQEEMKEMKSDILELKADVHQLKADVHLLKVNVHQLKVEVKDIKDGQERQDRILEMLSVKSIETDSYIRDFKRRL